MTTRFDESTGRPGNQRPTDKFDGQPDFNSLSLNKGDLVDERFIIQETILTESGEADIFRCKDYRTGEDAEYACRAGSTTPFNTGENLTTNQANYGGNYPYDNKQKGVFRQNTVAVNSFVPNAFGLYNMHGNVAEWCSDWYDGFISRRVRRGGSWYDFAEYCRSALRNNNFTPDYRNGDIGFRLVFVP